jgi:hypothetical protein
MNNYQIKQYSEQFADKSITINPYIMKKLGIIKAKSLIRINDYQLVCVPYTISLSDCRILLILSPREQSIITEGSKGNIMLHLEFHHPNLDKDIPLFFRIAIKSFKQLNTRLNQCLLEASLLTVPQDYREILLEYFLKNEENLTIYKDPELSEKIVTAKQFEPLKMKKQGFIRFSNDLKLHCRIITTSLQKIVLFIDTEESILKSPPEKIILEIILAGDPFFINSSFLDYSVSTEVEGFFIVSLKLEYSSILTEGLAPLLKGEKIPQEETIKEEKPIDESSVRDEEAEENSDADDVLEESPVS